MRGWVIGLVFLLLVVPLVPVDARRNDSIRPQPSNASLEDGDGDDHSNETQQSAPSVTVQDHENPSPPPAAKPQPFEPERARDLSWLSEKELKLIEDAKRVQGQADELTRKMHDEQNKARRTFAKFIARTLAHRNQLLRDVPHFWYDAIRAIPGHETFLSQRDSSIPMVVDALLDDHYILFSYLRNVRCHRVHGNSAHTKERVESIVQQTRDNKVAEDSDDEADDSSVPKDSHSGVYGQNADILDESFRLEFEFDPNPYFTTTKLFKQVPASASMLLYDQVDSDDPYRSDRRSEALGLGNSINWIGKTTGIARQPTSFFALFDDELYRTLDPENQRALQMRFGAMVANICTYLEHNPLPFYERSALEKEHLNALEGEHTDEF